jgi:putative SOS response-associated peptidase YedK
MVPIVRQDPKQPIRRLTLAKWGLVPSWSQDASAGAKMINARAESVNEKPAFRDSFRSRRCLVPASGFYEWRKLEKGKQPFHVGLPDGRLFGLAGIWDRWKSPAGEWLKSCSIITVPANQTLADIHDRMPLVIREEDYDLWLDPGLKDAKALQELLEPRGNDALKTYPVSNRVSDVKNDDPECAREQASGKRENDQLAMW